MEEINLESDLEITDLQGEERASISALVRNLFLGTRNVDTDEFPRWALGLVKTIIPCNSCFWGVGSVFQGQWHIHNYYLENQPEEMMENYARYADQDFLCASVCESPGTTFDTYHLISREDFIKTDIYRQHISFYGMEHVLCTAIRHPVSNLFHLISLYRDDYDNPYSEIQRRTVEFLSPLLVDAHNLNMFIRLNQSDYTIRGSCSAISDSKGILRESESGFPDLILREWREWRGPELPFYPESLLEGKQEAEFQGEHLVVTLRPWNDLIYIQVRGKGLFDRLTDAEQKVAGHLAFGLTNKEIAKALSISPKTVSNHLSSIFAKLDVPNRQRAIAMLKALS